MQFTQIILTDEQALLSRLAIDMILQDPERFEMSDEERADYQRLAVFYGVVATEPTRFPPKGEMARTVKSIVRRAKGPAQPQSRRKRRSQGQQKRDRAARREFVKQYNEAVKQYQREQEEIAEYERELQEKFANEPRVMVMRADGQPILTDVPVSMIVPMPDLNEDGPALAAEERIYVPGQRPDAE